ncbi:hypothetical protein LR48_Vigan01g006000 [Vigna angularis]|uniref:Uncharacterized protein n=1 Tax=Phaseolus angularis TaxID=3914 RepID=A0A0L9TJ67_PHAAN|nr:hypothetical protein LR48_Vigan01g006000 [Vigna angularis]
MEEESLGWCFVVVPIVLYISSSLLHIFSYFSLARARFSSTSSFALRAKFKTANAATLPDRLLVKTLVFLDRDSSISCVVDLMKRQMKRAPQLLSRHCFVIWWNDLCPVYCTAGMSG